VFQAADMMLFLRRARAVLDDTELLETRK